MVDFLNEVQERFPSGLRGSVFEALADILAAADRIDPSPPELEYEGGKLDVDLSPHLTMNDLGRGMDLPVNLRLLAVSLRFPGASLPAAWVSSSSR
jgi:hypothetical protein